MNEYNEHLVRLEVRLRIANKKLEKIEPCINRLHSWCYAYPDNIFKEVDKDTWLKANKVLAKANISMTAMNASNMRHIINGVKEIADDLTKFIE